MSRRDIRVTRQVFLLITERVEVLAGFRGRVYQVERYTLVGLCPLDPSRRVFDLEPLGLGPKVYRIRYA